MRLDKLTNDYEPKESPEKRDMADFYNEINQQDDLFYPVDEQLKKLKKNHMERIQ